MSKAPESRKAIGGRRWWSLAFVCLAVIVIVMDGSIVNVALPTLSLELPHTTNSELQWIVDAYILTFATLLLTAGSAADRLGRKRVLMTGLVSFAAVSCGAAMSGTSGELIAWRVLMGVGAAMIFPSTLAIITEAFPEPNLRKTAIAIWAGSSGLGVAIGPVAGGWMLSRFHWGSVFAVNLPLVAAAAIGIGLCVRESRDEAHGTFDPLGCLLSALGVFGLVWGLIEAPDRGWASWPTLMALTTAAVLLMVFVAWERRSPAPMLDLRYLRNRQFAAASIALASAFFGLFGFVFMVTQFFQFLRGYDALSAGLRTSPFAGFILAGALIAARSGQRWSTRALIATGLLLMSAGFAWAAGDTDQTPYVILVCQMCVLGIGLGLVNATATEAIMSSLPPQRAGTGSSVNDTLREVGGTLGVAAMGSAFNWLYRLHVSESLQGSPLPEDARALVRSSIGAANHVVARVEQLAGVNASSSLRASIQRAFLDGFVASCWIACGITFIGAAMVMVVLRRRTAISADQPL
jgi:EmrB/QacA subfamily drug resistance transporter